jgi:hypothetical protein
MLRPEPFQSSVRFEKIRAVFASNSSDDRTVSDPERTSLSISRGNGATKFMHLQLSAA